MEKVHLYQINFKQALECLNQIFKTYPSWEFPGDLAVKDPDCNCCALGWVWSMAQELLHAVSMTKNKTKQNKTKQTGTTQQQKVSFFCRLTPHLPKPILQMQNYLLPFLTHLLTCMSPKLWQHKNGNWSFWAEEMGHIPSFSPSKSHQKTQE